MRGRSVEEEARLMLRDGLLAEPAVSEQTLGTAMRALSEPLGGMVPTELRESGERPQPDFSGPEFDADDDEP